MEWCTVCSVQPGPEPTANLGRCFQCNLTSFGTGRESYQSHFLGHSCGNVDYNISKSCKERAFFVQRSLDYGNCIFHDISCALKMCPLTLVCTFIAFVT